jgi:nucleoside 2-deoxyribosyltransferase
MTYCYLAGRFRHRYLLQGYRGELARIGIQTTSRWLDLKEENEADAAECARIDITDIECADMLISFPESARSLPPTRGGAFFEEGFALASGKRVIVIQNRVHIFHHVMEYYPTWGHCIATLKAEQTPTRLAA